MFYFSVNCFSQEVKIIEKSQLPDSLGKNRTVYKINDTLSYLYTRPKLFSFVRNSIDNIILSPQEYVKKKNLWIVAGVAASTAITIYYDGKIYTAARQFGKFVGIDEDNPTINLSPVKGVPLYIPSDLSSALYYIGDGINELAIDGGFYLYGSIKSDNRALRTSCELSEGMVTVGIYIQLLKHLTGRETPMRRSVERGRWRCFPSLKEYSSSVPTYDAFPSGHLATAMMTVIVISMNYPEYKFIKPLGYTLMGICGYQMINNGVHWISDYPLAIAMGYFIGKIAVNNGRRKIVNTDNNIIGLYPDRIKPTLKIRPAYLGYGVTGLSLSLKF